MDRSIIRISKEIGDIQLGSDLSIAVAFKEANVRDVRAIIIGPHETPYQFGFFEFSITFNKDYPSTPPTVRALTTNHGRCRFNPNIYACGKVCLSILGTWRGEPGEQWSSAQGLESILISIQSLMSSNPYENEPGFESRTTHQDKKNQRAYALKIRHETLRISIIQRLEEYLNLRPEADRKRKLEVLKVSDDDTDSACERQVPFEPFKDLCKRRFLWYYDSLLASVRQGLTETKESSSFVLMPFEISQANNMSGTFNYVDLEKRLRKIKAALELELHAWKSQGLDLVKSESTVAVKLQHQFTQSKVWMKESESANNISLEDGNPFIWVITYFGQPMTNLDGAVLTIKLHLSPNYPTDQPRAICQQRIFHHHITSNGHICYSPSLSKRDDVRSHVEAILRVLNDDEPVYDPRECVCPEATRLYWNAGPEGRKLYNRKVRRSVRDSMEPLLCE